MSWTLGGDAIPVPKGKRITRSIQSVLHRTLNGNFTRDFIGDEKLIVEADYNNIDTDYLDIILAHYDTQKSTGASVLMVIDDLNISIPVLIDLGPENYTIEECYRYRRISLVFHETEAISVIS